MSVGAEVYQAVNDSDELSSGDIAFLSLARTRLVGETPPGEAYDSLGRIPGYPTPAVLPLPHGREIALDTMFALVVTHSCEIDRQKNLDVEAGHFDCRLTVAPIVPEPNVHVIDAQGDDQVVNWAAIEANEPVASLYLPPVPDLSVIATGLDPLPWPRSFADLRGLVTVSRGMVETDRLMSLAPQYLGTLQRQLARFFTWRDLARHELVQGLVGRRVVDAIPLNARGDRLRVALMADDGSSLTVELRSK
jgi:hypothetical protein